MELPKTTPRFNIVTKASERYDKGIEASKSYRSNDKITSFSVIENIIECNSS